MCESILNVKELKLRRHILYRLLQFLKPLTKAWADFFMDIIVKLSSALFQGKVVNSILVIMDWFTKYVDYVPCLETMSEYNFMEIIFNCIVIKTGELSSFIID